jgi:hypothetical protein
MSNGPAPVLRNKGLIHSDNILVVLSEPKGVELVPPPADSFSAAKGANAITEFFSSSK